MEQYINGELSPESQAKVDYIRERPIYYDDKLKKASLQQFSMLRFAQTTDIPNTTQQKV